MISAYEGSVVTYVSPFPRKPMTENLQLVKLRRKTSRSAKLHVLNVGTLCGPIFYRMYRRGRWRYGDYCQAAIDTKFKWLLIKITYCYDNRISFYSGNLRCSTHQTAFFDLRSSRVCAFCFSYGIPTFLHKNMAAWSIKSTTSWYGALKMDRWRYKSFGREARRT